MWPTTDLATFTEKILNGKVHFLCSAWRERNEKENTEEVIEILENEMQDKESINDTDRFHRLGKNIPEVDLGL